MEKKQRDEFVILKDNVHTDIRLLVSYHDRIQHVIVSCEDTEDGAVHDVEFTEGSRIVVCCR